MGSGLRTENIKSLSLNISKKLNCFSSIDSKILIFNLILKCLYLKFQLPQGKWYYFITQLYENINDLTRYLIICLSLTLEDFLHY